MKRKTIFIIKILQDYSLPGFDIMKYGRQVSLKGWYLSTIPCGIKSQRTIVFSQSALKYFCVYCIGRCVANVGNVSLGLYYFPRCLPILRFCLPS